MSQYTTRPLDTATWDAFGRLLDKHNGAGFGAGWYLAGSGGTNLTLTGHTGLGPA